MPVPSMFDMKLRSDRSDDVASATTELRDALARSGGVIARTASELGLSVRTLFRLVKRAGLSDYAAELRRGTTDRSVVK